MIVEDEGNEMGKVVEKMRKERRIVEDIFSSSALKVQKLRVDDPIIVQNQTYRAVKRQIGIISNGKLAGEVDAFYGRSYTSTLQCNSDFGEVFECKASDFFSYIQYLQGGFLY